MLKLKTCKVCKREFTPNNTIQKYCRGCSYKVNLEQSKKSFKKKTKERKKSDRTQLLEWALKAKEKAHHICEYCGGRNGLNTHHIYSRSKKSVRYDLDNSCVLCVAHHIFSSKFSAHKTPEEFHYFLVEKRGQEFMDKLREKANRLEV